MNAILIATQQSANCFPLTVNKPDALMQVFNKTLLEHSFYSLPKVANRITIVAKEEHINLIKQLQLPFPYHVTTESEVTYKSATFILDAHQYHHRQEAGTLPQGPFPIRYAWDLLTCQETYASEMIRGASDQAFIENRVTIKGDVFIGEGTMLKSGVYIEGPVMIGAGCTIGPNCYIRGNTSIGNGCRIGNAVEIKNSIIGQHVNICHLSYVGDSIIGNNTNLGAGFINANLRHDQATVITLLNGERVDTGRQKLGAIVGDGVHTGIHTAVYPGRKIAPGLTTLPGEVVSKDKYSPL